MRIEQAGVRGRLRSIVRALAVEDYLFDDLYQEALICLWCTEEKSPGWSEKAYFKRCRFHVIDFLRRGRSIDAVKRRHNRWNPPENEAINEKEELDCLPEGSVSHDDAQSRLFMGDIIHNLMPLLNLAEQQ